VRILISTDSFPPRCGGSGWSTYELARELRTRGHDVVVLKVTAGASGDGSPEGLRYEAPRYEGIDVVAHHEYAPNVPGVRNYFKNERLYPRVARRIERLIEQHGIDIVHGQHVLSAPPAVMAARRARIPSVVTVRDYWPVCYRSDLLHTPRGLALCPGCSRAADLHHGRPNIGFTGFAKWLAQRYVIANMATKEQALLDADAVIAVSGVIAQDLVQRAPELARARIEVIPNPVNVRALVERPRGEPPMDGPYALYVGKLAVNKGTDHLVPAVIASGLDWPLVIAGDGPDRDAIKAAARAANRDVRLLGWLEPEAVAGWIAHAAMLIFPSRGPESLSRVLIEASALGVPIAAMHTGGTADIVQDEVTGLLSNDARELADDIRRLREDPDLRARLGQAAARHALNTFDAAAVVTRVEAVYRRLLGART
jgi:glycosyltransferase involved in cell wall biosynthesis